MELNSTMTLRGPSAFDDLFLKCTSQISPEAITRWCPGDPGYKSYVKEWQQIWRSKRVPTESNFEVSETVGLTLWEANSDPEFLRFRCFTNSVALKLMCVHRQEVVFDLNYPLIRLLSDIISLRDHAAMKLFTYAIEVAERECAAGIEFLHAVPWLAHTRLLAAALNGNTNDLPNLSRHVIDMDKEFRASVGRFSVSGTFLLSLTSFDTLHPIWVSLSKNLLAPHCDIEGVALILDAFSDFQPPKGSIQSDGPSQNEDLRAFHCH